MFPALSKCDGWLFFHFSFSFVVSPELEDLVSKCERHQDTICRCKKGYYKFNIDSVAYDCRKCQSCDQDEIEKQKCTYSNGRCNKSLSITTTYIYILCVIFGQHLIVFIVVQRCSQAHRRQTPCANAKRTSTESTKSVSSAPSEYSRVSEIMKHVLFPLCSFLCLHLKMPMRK